MNGIKMKDCRFYVNEAERTVICVIPYTRDMVSDFIHEHFRWNDIDFWMGMDKMESKIDMPRSFVGKAVCDPSDEWNEETGRMLAFSRAKDKCYKSFFKRANRFVQTVDGRLGDMITLFNDFGLKLENKRKTLQNELDRRIPKEKE